MKFEIDIFEPSPYNLVSARRQVDAHLMPTVGSVKFVGMLPIPDECWGHEKFNYTDFKSLVELREWFVDHFGEHENTWTDYYNLDGSNDYCQDKLCRRVVVHYHFANLNQIVLFKLRWIA